MPITDIFSSLIIAFAFFTIIPMPKLNWSERRMKLVPLMMPLVGLVIGLGAFGLFTLFSALASSPFLCGVLLCLYFAVVSGGLHLDGLMDSADAYFSRRERSEKLEIMSDSSVGAFSVFTVFFVLLLKVAVFYELFSQRKEIGILLIFIPVLSRILQASMLYLFPKAKADGLAKAFGQLNKPFAAILFALLFAIGLLLFPFAGISSIITVAAVLAFYALFYFSAKKHFGGITGDLLGAFLELSELLMLITLLFV